MRTLCSFLLFLCLASAGVECPAQTPVSPQADRLALHPDLIATTRLSGHIPGWARPQADEGLIPEATPLRITLVLTRSPERQAAFLRLLADQQNPASPSYHQWLTPQQVGERYGPTQHDLDVLSVWLTSSGLTVTEIAPSRVFLHAAAPAGVLAHAFSTTLHSFRVGAESRRAPISEPALPSALAPLVDSITGLADTPLEPMHQSRSMAAPSTNTAEPGYSLSSGTHYVTPGDFSLIFDLKPTYSAGYNGTGQKVAIIGRSRVAATDISLFEANTGLATNLPNTIIPTTGVDPGITGNGDQGEATLDVIRVVGTAPGVQADLVVSGTAGGFNGIYVAAQYEVQTLLDPVMNISFGSCEVFAGPSQVNLWDTLFAQAASEGISVFVSSADSGAATCDTQFAQVPAYQFRSINYICASSFATCVGGTEFADSNPSPYWSTTNGPGLVSALSYIPEGAWNEPMNVTGGGTFWVAASGGGGASIFIPKPSWQTGTGVPADGARDVPDVSFPASAHDGYYGCYAAGNGDCANNRFEYFAGTSAAAPTMAAVTALLNQKTGSSQGNLNPLLYRIAASTPAAFHDTTPASSGVTNCSTDLASLCNNSTPGVSGLTGGQAGFALATGYDQATGLGSLDITNFLNAAAPAISPLAPGKLTLTETASTITSSQTVAFTATFTSPTAGTPSGTVQFFANAVALGTPIPLSAGKAVTAALPFTAAGSYDITAIYSGDTKYAQTTAPGLALTVTGLASIAKITLPATSFQLGDSATFTLTVTPTAGSVVPTGKVRFYSVSGGVGTYIATVPLTAAGTATTPVPTLAAGTYTVTAFYLGDTVYSPSTSAAVTYTVQRLPVVLSLSTAAPTVGIGGYRAYSIFFIGLPSATSYPVVTGTLQLYSNGAPLGAPITIATSANSNLSIAPPVSAPILYTTPGPYIITVAYSGDANFAPFTGAPITTTVLTTPAAYQLSASPTALTFPAGSALYNVSTLFAAPTDGFEGSINLACAVTYTGTGTPTLSPTCTLSNSTASLGPKFSGNVGTVTINTKAGSSLRTPSVRAQLPSDPKIPATISEATALCVLVLSFTSARRRRWRTSLATLTLSLLFAVLLGCGSNSNVSSTPPTTLGTTKGVYNVTVTASTSTAGIPMPTPSIITVTVN